MTAPMLTGTRVLLAPLRMDDSSLLYGWINDRELVERSAPFRQIARAEHDAWFTRIREREDVRIFGIRLRDSDRLVGSCQLNAIHPLNRSAELQIRIGAADARGRGVGTEAIRLLLAYAFDELGLHRVSLYVFATNAVAQRLYDSVGFRAEGVLREAAWVGGEWLDLTLMALLESEFRR